MTEVDFLPNSDVEGLEVPGGKPKLFSLFPTESLGEICMPTKEVGMELLGDMM